MVLTGASSGIGEMAAQQLAASGATVVLVARRQSELEALRDKINHAGGTAASFPADLSQADEREALIERITAQHGTPDVLVNNAAKSIRRSIDDSATRFHDYERTMALNYLGPVHLTLGFLPQMKQRGSGHIVNVSTMAALLSVAPRYSAYAASKKALGLFGKTLAAELSDTDIAVTTIYYPLVDTPMAAPTPEYAGRPALSAAEAAEWILHAIRTRPDAVAPRGSRTFGLLKPLIPDAVINQATQRWI
ncbi:SDR family NAD(P)-dependent oxidoreductase [Mycolicibacter minnesotensis]